MSRNRVTVALPRELIEEIDALMGQRRRSSFISEAAREKVIRLKKAKAIRRFAGSPKDADYPEWNNGSAEWVHNLRHENESSPDRPERRRRPAKRKTRTR